MTVLSAPPLPPLDTLVDLRQHTLSREPKPKMRILYLCHRVPYPPDKGEKIRAFHELRALGRRHRVHLLTLADGDVPDLGPLEQLCERVEVFSLRRRAAYARAALGLVRSRPLTLSFFESVELQNRVEELARTEKFDLIVVYSSAMAPYAEPFQGTPAVLDMVDVDSAKWAQYSRFAALPLRPVYALESRRLQAYEASLSNRFERIVLATGNETRLLKDFAPEAKAATIPNGVDLDFFRPLDLPKIPHPSLVFTGQMDYFANIDGVVHFSRNVMPRLRRRFPDLELVIVGRSPAPAVRALTEVPGVYVTGAVGDVRPFLERAWAFVAPLRIAQGVQNKVLEAMSMNLPVVCTDRVLAGLSEGGFRHGRDLLAAADDDGLEACITSVLEDARMRAGLAECAHQRLAVSYRWTTNMDRFEEILTSAVRRPASAASAASAAPAQPAMAQVGPVGKKAGIRA
ncbi:MAG TPA: TIGR03087 family PEP-CTERM/XrtA system glycosyltransferase [Thermoanaerobaculia bacterium]|jgi:sugar transferase (PEP-CTERM/EpsH1 system associated)|nr:TIGR03087 family PEP-CTERM/XrtA system glycosyltransferase [Thermoanaerobaculia bacterium]